MIFFHYKINHIFLIPKINNYWLIIWLKIIQKEEQKFHKNEVYNIKQVISENNVMQRVKQCWVLTTGGWRAGWGAGVNTFQYVGPLVIIIYIRKQSDRGHTLYSDYYILILIDIARYQDRRLFLFFLLPHSVQLGNFCPAWNLAILQVGPRSGIIFRLVSNRPPAPLGRNWITTIWGVSKHPQGKVKSWQVNSGHVNSGQDQ